MRDTVAALGARVSLAATMSALVAIPNSAALAFTCSPQRVGTRPLELAGVRHLAVEAIVPVGDEPVSEASATPCAQVLFARRLIGEVARTPGADVILITFTPIGRSGRPDVRFIFRKTDGMWRLL